MTYKVMLVDDDSLVRMGLRHSVDWAAKGLELAGEAADGGEALEMMDSLRPDIVCSDMYMPKFDGIKFITQALARYPDTVFVVLSCHNDFQYIKESLRLGVYDYLLKSSIVNSDELERVLDNIMRLLDEKRSRPEPAATASGAQPDEPAPQREIKGMLSAYLHGQTELESALTDRLPLLSGVSPDSPLYLLGIDFDNYASMLAVFRDAALLDYAIENILNEIIGEHGGGMVVSAKNHVFYALMRVVTKNSFITPDDKVLSICEWIRINIKNNLKSTCSLYVPARTDFASLPEVFDVLSDEIGKRHPHNFDTIVDLRGFAPGAPEEEPGRAADPVDACIEHILMHYRERISLDDLAALTGMSKFHLCKKFKDRTNASIVNYILQVRVDKAKELLLRNRNKVFVVANLVGFNDVSYFNRAFKKLTGLSPTEYVEHNSSILTVADE